MSPLLHNKRVGIPRLGHQYDVARDMSLYFDMAVNIRIHWKGSNSRISIIDLILCVNEVFWTMIKLMSM